MVANTPVTPARSPRRGTSSRGTARQTRKDGGFKTLALHVTEAAGRNAFDKLRADRPKFAAFALATSQPAKLDPETAAKQILQHALASPIVPSLTAPKVSGTESEFKSLGIETVPLTNTSVVKFRQEVKGIPVYGSLVSVELDDNNEAVSINSNLASPDVSSNVAKLSPQSVLKKVAARAGYGDEMPDVTPELTYYLDNKGKWHLAYIVENVPLRKRPDEAKLAEDGGNQFPLVFDYIIDALTGAFVAEIPRTPTMAAVQQIAADELNKPRTFRVENNNGVMELRDTELNIITHDFNWDDPKVEVSNLPGAICVSPPNWGSAAVSAHVNAGLVSTFLRDVLKRNNIDNKGSPIISSVNCVARDEEKPAGSRIWLNAFWHPIKKQMVYGQARFDNSLRSLASALNIVGHELFHGVTQATCDLQYELESGALNESYSDIFGILISNFPEPDIAKWDWQIGDGVSTDLDAFRDFRDPTKHNQPKHMMDFVVRKPPAWFNDYGAVHTNSGIHNFAAYSIMTARNGAEGFLFAPAELAAMFYIALTQQLSRQSGFVDSRRGVVMATRSLFRNLSPEELTQRVGAIEAGFDAAGIT
jgi:Zn-dependent metalloprotease